MSPLTQGLNYRPACDNVTITRHNTRYNRRYTEHGAPQIIIFRLQLTIQGRKKTRGFYLHAVLRACGERRSAKPALNRQLSRYFSGRLAAA